MDCRIWEDPSRDQQFCEIGGKRVRLDRDSVEDAKHGGSVRTLSDLGDKELTRKERAAINWLLRSTFKAGHRRFWPRLGL